MAEGRCRMSQASQRGVSLATTPPRRYRVTFQDDTTWEGTRRELFAMNPDWWKYAVEIQPPVPRDTQEDYSGDDLTQVEQDYADADNPRLNRMPRSAIHYQSRTGQRVRAEWRPGTVVQRRKSALPGNETGDLPRVAPRRRRRGWFRSHPLLWLGLGMFVMLGAWTGLQAFSAWWSVHTDDVNYGRPRTAQYDVVVGHEDSAAHPTHVIAINLNSEVVIIELPGGDTAKSIIYKGPRLFGPGSDLAPVTLTFKDTTGSGRLDMLVHVQGAIVLYLNQKVNNIWQFVPQQNH